MVDLLDYWCEFPSSITDADPERNFNYALRRATWMATRLLFQGRVDDESVVSVEDLTPSHDDAGDTFAAFDIPDPLPGPEEQVIRKSTLDQAREFLASVPERELKLWLKPFLDEESETDQARREGVSQQAISQRRLAGLKRIVRAAEAAGLR